MTRRLRRRRLGLRRRQQQERRSLPRSQQSGRLPLRRPPPLKKAAAAPPPSPALSSIDQASQALSSVDQAIPIVDEASEVLSSIDPVDSHAARQQGLIVRGSTLVLDTESDIRCSKCGYVANVCGQGVRCVRKATSTVLLRKLQQQTSHLAPHMRHMAHPRIQRALGR